jgi:tetratricopeptide (TPR) repeat protein
VAVSRFRAAEDDYLRALELDPGPDFRYRVLVNRGGMYFQAGRLDRAIADAESAIRLDPGPYQPHALLYQVLRRQGRLADAAAALDRAIERRPDRPDLFRARALLAAGPDADRADFARDLTPDRRDAALRDLDRAIELEKSPLQKADDHVSRGQILVAAGRADQALAAYDTAIRLVPGNATAHRLRAFALLELRRHDEVLAACDRGLALGPPSAELLEARGLARLERKDFRGAIDDFTIALSLSPGSAPLAQHRAWAYLYSDAFRLAAADFDAALGIDPGLGDAYGGRALARIGLGSWRDALADADQAVRLATSGQKQRVLFNAARVYAQALRPASEEVSRRGQAALSLYRQLRGRAAALLLESARQVPTDRRERFWRDVVASDPILRPFLPGPG